MFGQIHLNIMLRAGRCTGFGTVLCWCVCWAREGGAAEGNRKLSSLGYLFTLLSAGVTPIHVGHKRQSILSKPCSSCHLKPFPLLKAVLMWREEEGPPRLWLRGRRIQRQFWAELGAVDWLEASPRSRLMPPSVLAVTGFPNDHCFQLYNWYILLSFVS